jgi:hypothetical protein
VLLHEGPFIPPDEQKAARRGSRHAVRLHEWGTQGLGWILGMGHPPNLGDLSLAVRRCWFYVWATRR